MPDTPLDPSEPRSARSKLGIGAASLAGVVLVLGVAVWLQIGGGGDGSTSPSDAAAKSSPVRPTTTEPVDGASTTSTIVTVPTTAAPTPVPTPGAPGYDAFMAEVERQANLPAAAPPPPPTTSPFDAERQRLDAERAAAEQEAARERASAQQAALQSCLDEAALQLDVANQTADQRRRQAESDAVIRGTMGGLAEEYAVIEADRSNAQTGYDLAVQSCRLQYG